MKFFSYIKSHKLFSFILLLIIISSIMLPIYFLVINKSNSSSPTETKAAVAPVAPVSAQTPTQHIIPTMGPNELGFITNNTINGVDEPKWFLSIYLSEKTCVDADNSTPYTLNTVQSKWFYDKNNEYSIERTILNTNNAYSQEELSALGKTTKPNTYLVNQIIFLYDKNNINLTKGIPMIIKPMIFTTYGNFQKMTN